jgi:hypothetical protein
MAGNVHSRMGALAEAIEGVDSVSQSVDPIHLVADQARQSAHVFFRRPRQELRGGPDPGKRVADLVGESPGGG